MYGLYILVNKSHRTALLWYVYIVKSVKFFWVEIAIPFPGFLVCKVMFATYINSIINISLKNTILEGK